MTELGYGLFDCDTHCYETRDSFTRYLPKQWHEYAIAPVRMHDGDRAHPRRRTGSRSSTPSRASASTWPTGRARSRRCSGRWRPATRTRPTSRSRCEPEYLDRESRLKLMDAQGVERAVVFPSAMALSVENYVKHVPAAYANIHSFNQWFDEEWGFSRDGRIFAPALLSLRDLDLAVQELDFVLAAGPGSCCCPPAPPTAARRVIPTSTRSGRG